MPERPDTAGDVAALKDLMEWMRKEGFWCETLTVGSVQLVTARDFLPSVKAQERKAATEDEKARGAEVAGTYVDEFGGDLPGFKEMTGRA